MHHKSRSYDVWFLRYKVQRTKFCAILGHFFGSLTLLTNQKIKILKKKCLKTSFYTLHFTFYTLPQIKIMMYGSWYIRHDRQNVLSFRAIFLPFYPSNNPENQNFEKMKKVPGDIIIYTSVPSMAIIWYMVPDISTATDRFFGHIWPIFPFLSP